MLKCSASPPGHPLPSSTVLPGAAGLATTRRLEHAMRRPLPNNSLLPYRTLHTQRRLSLELAVSSTLEGVRSP